VDDSDNYDEINNVYYCNCSKLDIDPQSPLLLKDYSYFLGHTDSSCLYTDELYRFNDEYTQIICSKKYNSKEAW
jgi:hypothetical protein